MSSTDVSTPRGDMVCRPCMGESTSTETLMSPHCDCPTGEHGLIIHKETCLLYNYETFAIPQDQGKGDSADECKCDAGQCRCIKKAGREAFDAWRNNREIAGAMPAVLESSHPLMQKFQETLKRFLEKENALAQSKILELQEEIRLSKDSYDKDLEEIYRRDNDCNAQRVLIEEYEANLSKTAADRARAEKIAHDSTQMYRKAKEKLDQDMITEREATVEMEALTNLCRQLEKWREETESELTISHAMSDKMKKEKKAIADEKRELDMIIFNLNSEIWKLQSKLDMFQKQYEVKNKEMGDINDKVSLYSAELEDLDLDKRRLVGLWNAVLVNIRQRDRVYDSVRDDYKNLQVNFRTLVNNLDVTKKELMDEINKGKDIAMHKDKQEYDLQIVTKQFDTEDAKRATFEAKMEGITESIEMIERDQELVKMENNTLSNILSTTVKDVEKKTIHKLKMENEILANLQEIMLNDKAVESMASGIKKMRDISRKQETSLKAMEAQHAKIMLDIEMSRSQQATNNQLLNETMQQVQAKEQCVTELEEQYEQNNLSIMRTQRELDLLNKKYTALKEIQGLKTPQQIRLDALEGQIRALRERTEQLQDEWLRLQAHVVAMTEHHNKLVTDVNLIVKQIQICDQKSMRIEAECEHVRKEQRQGERSLRELRARLEVAEGGRKEARERNDTDARATAAISHEYTANLKDAEFQIIELEEEIECFEKEKNELIEELDSVQREALIWQRKGILAVELKKNVKNAQSAAGEIGQMKTEIHKMEVRKEQLNHIAEKLASDLARCVTQREAALERNRATAAAAEKHREKGLVSKTHYHHKLRLARADITRVTKDVAETTAQIQELEQRQEILQREMKETEKLNNELEENIVGLLRECTTFEREKQWLLERIVRSQRLGKELESVIKRQSLKVRKTKANALQDITKARALNDRIYYIVEILEGEFPFLQDKLSTIKNTLNIQSPTNSPRMVVEHEVETFIHAASLNVAEKPLSDD